MQFSPIAALPPLTGPAGRRDSDAATVTTTWTSSTGSSRSSVFELEKLGRPRSWSSRGRQALLAQSLCAAARAGDDATIRSLVGQGVDVNNSRCGLQPRDDGPERERERERRLKSVLQRNLEPTPLHYAAEEGHASAVETLVSCGADLGARARRGRTPLHVANGAAIAALIQLGADTCARDEAGQVPLHRLAADGLLAGVDAVLAAATSPVDAQNKARQTPLHLACQNDHHDVAHALLRAGAYVNAADRDGLRPLHYLARHGRPPLVRLLRDANADVEAQALHLLRPLHDAARTGCPAVVEALLAASADVEATTDDGSTPLHLAVAATNDAAATVAALLAARANVAASTAKNEQPLHLALRRGSVAVAALLLQHGADANARLRDGTVPLIQACSSTAAAQDTLSTVEILLAHGADPSATNCPGVSPLSAACSRPELASDLVRLLVANGASPRHQDFRALWRNGKLSIWEKRAAHAIMTEAAVPELRKSEVEWLMVAR
ncbi:Ankyrin repeat domain-containing protein 16 [Diplodia seriata]|uniref:Ankyrin repeat domain-containing protein 16 n=1 Tax=Diplodia seriata TaxID=420778 RepID=A0ABR3CAP9_9PEZI